MSGLGMLVPYFECHYPEVLASSSPMGMSGLGDFVSPFNFPIPQQLQPGDIRQLVGLGCADCGGGCGCGLGFFDSGMDFSQWGIAEWATVAFGLYIAGSMIADVKTIGKSVRVKAKGASRKARKGAANSVSSLGKLAIAGAAGAGIYFWAQSQKSGQ